ncbi:MAG: hypothetical protein NTY47_06765 [Candidatus Omnitrophica bacterium]|nr:hypothetical protein [Candidatus Omnitrophota bacterium]
MPYDASLDEQLFAKSTETEAGRITVSVYSYNNGAKKIQVTRENKDQEGNFRFTKLGRLNKTEAQDVMRLMNEALAQMG